MARPTTIPDAFGGGELGDLYALLNWSEILDVLDEAVAGSTRNALLLDADGKVIAASAGLRQRKDIEGFNLADWRPRNVPDEVYMHGGALLGYDDLLVGGAASTGYKHFQGIGWSMLIVETTDRAFATVWRLMAAMLGLLLLTLALAGWIASRLAHRIARPITGLADVARPKSRGGRN